MELPTTAGPADNLYVTVNGNLALAECKLWRNPEARRQVIAQVIDYAHAMARWSYEELEANILKGKRLDNNARGGLYSLFGEESELDESAFVDAVSRNLRLGRILLLLVGDGIREGVETLSAFLQMHAGFHFAFGVIEMQVFRMPSQGFLVQPRVLARTVNIERGIVRLSDGHLKVEPPETPIGVSEQRTSISEDQLFELLRLTAPETADALKRFRAEAEQLGVFIEPAPKSLQLKWYGPDEVAYPLGGISTSGELRTYSLGYKSSYIGRLDLWHSYLDKLATAIGGKIRHTPKPEEWYLVKEGKDLPEAMDLLSQSHKWLDTIRWYVGELSTAIESRSA